MTISCIIPAWNLWETTRACLLSLAEHSQGEDMDVVVVDNGSTDATREALAPLGEQLFGARFTALLARMAQRHALWLLASFVLAVGDGDVDVAPARVEIEPQVRMALPGKTLGVRAERVLRAFAGDDLTGAFDDMCRQWFVAHA